MKILFVSECYPSEEAPQLGVFLEQQADALQKLGHDVTTLHITKLPGKHDVFENEKLQNEIRIVKYHLCPSEIKRKLVIPDRLIAFEEYLQSNRFDVASVHIVGPYTLQSVVKACKATDTRCVVHCHGLNVWHECPESFKLKLLSPYLIARKISALKKADAIVSVSNCVKMTVNKYIKNNVYTVYNGVNVARFHPCGKANDVFNILSVGNYIFLKGQRFLIEAAASVIQQGYDIHVTLVGRGVEKDNLIDQINTLGLQEQMTVLDAVPYDEIAQMMREADMFILPSYYEAFGCVFVEAMASGAVTCGCFNNGPEEIIANDIDGLLVREKNAADIANAILDMVDNPDKKEKIAKSGVLKAQRFTWEASAKNLLDVYSRVLEKN